MDAMERGEQYLVFDWNFHRNSFIKKCFLLFLLLNLAFIAPSLHILSHYNYLNTYLSLINFPYIQVGQLNSSEGFSNYGTIEKNMMMEKHMELKKDYDEKVQELETAYDHLENLSNRLSAMIAARFVKIVDKHRIMHLLEAFAALRDDA